MIRALFRATRPAHASKTLGQGAKRLVKVLRWTPIILALAAELVSPQSHADSKLSIGTAGGGSAVAALFAAKEEGFFAARGLDVTIVQANLDPQMPAALLAHSLDVAATSTTTFFQAIDGGLDLVVVLGGTATSKRPTDEAVIARNDIGIKSPSDFVGRKVGVPGIGAALHVLFRYWLMERGVDFHRVDFAEASMPRMRDMLGAKILDAAVAVNPFIGQMTDAGVGYIAVPLSGQIPSGKPVIMYTATREWAAGHVTELEGFRAAIIEGAKFVAANPDKTKEDISHLVKIPLPVIQASQLSDQSPLIDTDDLAWWFAVMKRQDMLTRDIDLKTLLIH